MIPFFLRFLRVRSAASAALAIVAAFLPVVARSADAPPLAASQVDEIKKHEGRKVAVRGKARSAGATASGSLQFLNFEGTTFSMILRKQRREAVEAGLGMTFAALAGRELTVLGEVALYQGRPQIEVTDAKQVEAGAPAPAAAKGAVATIAITDTAALNAAEKKEVRVEGKVRAVGQSKNGNVNFINFEGVERGGFSCVVMRANVTAVELALGGELADVLPGKVLNVHGPVTIFNGAPQIEIKSADQVIVREVQP